MAIHPNFSEWYRSAAVAPSEGLLDKRWEGIQGIVEQPTPDQLLNLAKLFVLPNTTESSVPLGFRESFRAHDDSFPAKGELLELRVLAGIVIRLVIEADHPLAALAALALVCGSFGSREAILPEGEHLDFAQRFLVKHSSSTRQSREFTPITIPSLSLSQAQTVIEQLTQTAKVLAEEVGILWWLQTHFSRDLQRSFSDVGYVSGTLVLANELADLTKFVPGSDVAIAVLAYALMLAGAPRSTETLTIANATNETPRNWREKLCATNKVNSSGLLSPVLMAIHKSLETDGRDEWLQVYREECDIPADSAFPIIQISHQLFRERMLLRALREATS